MGGENSKPDPRQPELFTQNHEIRVKKMYKVAQEPPKIEPPPPVKSPEPVQMQAPVLMQIQPAMPMQIPVQIQNQNPVQMFSFQEKLVQNPMTVSTIQNQVPVQIQNMVPVQIQNQMPVQIQNPMPIQMQNQMPISIQNPVLVQMQNQIPVQNQNQMPVQVQESVPYQNQIQNPIMVQMQNQIPVQNQNQKPVQVQELVPYQNQIQNPIMVQMQNQMPVQVQEMVPYQNQVPVQKQNTIMVQMQNQMPIQVPFQMQNQNPIQMFTIPEQISNQNISTVKNQMSGPILMSTTSQPRAPLHMITSQRLTTVRPAQLTHNSAREPLEHSNSQFFNLKKKIEEIPNDEKVPNAASESDQNSEKQPATANTPEKEAQMQVQIPNKKLPQIPESAMSNVSMSRQSVEPLILSNKSGQILVSTRDYSTARPARMSRKLKALTAFTAAEWPFSRERASKQEESQSSEPPRSSSQMANEAAETEWKKYFRKIKNEDAQQKPITPKNFGFENRSTEDFFVLSSKKLKPYELVSSSTSTSLKSSRQQIIMVAPKTAQLQAYSSNKTQ